MNLIFCVFWHMQLNMSWYIRSFFGFTFLSILYCFKYSCTSIFHRRSLYTFEMRPVGSDQPGKRGRGWPLPVKEVVATNPFISDRGSFSQKDLKPSLLAAQNLAGFFPATNFLAAFSRFSRGAPFAIDLIITPKPFHIATYRHRFDYFSKAVP